LQQHLLGGKAVLFYTDISKMLSSIPEHFVDFAIMERKLFLM